jgi:lysophospholipid acyltransferase (LPLAT)-like uncharacterized protein
MTKKLCIGSTAWRSHVFIAVLACLATWLLRGLFLTLRPIYVQREFEHQVMDTGQPALLAVWHGRLLYFISLYRQQTGTVLVSPSKDGELVSRVLARFGLHATRGSSSRGGRQGLRQLIECVRQGGHAAFTPDGPRGPRYRVKAGLLSAAQKTGAPILPAVYNAKWKRVLRSWDRFIVPLPFSRIVVVYGKPIYVPATGSSPVLQEKRQEVEATLQHITNIADNFFSP